MNEALERCRKYVAKMPPAISGQHGHDATFAVASVAYHGFALNESDALAILREFNQRCSPPWKESELVHKTKSAATAPHDKPRGYLLGDAAGGSRSSNTISKPIEPDRSKARLQAKAKTALSSVLKQYPGGFAYYGNRSPVNLLDSDPRNDWRSLLQLFTPDDVVWIGRGPTDSAGADASPDWQAYCKTRFRPVSDWLRETTAPGNFTCPSTFKSGITSRSNDNVITRRYLVVESDSLNKNDVCAVFRWMEQFSRLRAIVDTAGRSLHGWFEMPKLSALDELKIILPQLGCDPALFKPAQPCRLPGAIRADKENRVQSLLYLDLEGLK
jgi:hypothetical protein